MSPPTDGAAASAAPPTPRPRAVAALGAVEIVLGAFSFFGGFVHIFLGIGSLVTFTGSEAILGAIANGLGTALVGFGVLFVIAGGATLAATRWAWPFGAVVAWAGLAAGVVSLGLGTVGAVPGLALAALTLGLLYRPSVRAFLKRSPSRPP